MQVVVLRGNLASEGVDVRPLPNEKCVGNFLLAVDRGFRRDSGTDFFRITVWNGAAVNAQKYLSKGDSVVLKGHLRTSSYEKTFENGAQGKVKVIEIHADEIEYLTPPPTSSGRSSGKGGR